MSNKQDTLDGKRVHGILFKGEMVRAILRDVDPKEMTRRLHGLDIVNELPCNPDDYTLIQQVQLDPDGIYRCYLQHKNGATVSAKPKWIPGDILYVKETFTIMDWWEDSKSVHVLYEDGEANVVTLTNEEWAKFEKWKNKEDKKPSLFMFRSLSRIILKVTDVKCERVCDISEEEAKEEGVTLYKNQDGTYGGWAEPTTHKEAFELLWTNINGEETWSHWCFAYSFKRI